jgi:hypothetical protein
MTIDQRYLGQEELKYVYERGKKRMEYHPELAEEYRKMIKEFPFYHDRNEAIEKAVQMSKNSLKEYQVWAKVGKDGDYYFIQDYYIVSNDYRILIAAEYVGMEQILR